MPREPAATICAAPRGYLVLLGGSRIGAIRERGGAYYGEDAAGRCLGRFEALPQAARAVVWSAFGRREAA